MSKIIMGIEVEKRHDIAKSVQDVLTEFGCFIKTRIGFHDASDDRTVCSEKGIIVLELIKDADEECFPMITKLSDVKGVVVKTMEF